MAITLFNTIYGFVCAFAEALSEVKRLRIETMKRYPGLSSYE